MVLVNEQTHAASWASQLVWLPECHFWNML